MSNTTVSTRMYEDDKSDLAKVQGELLMNGKDGDSADAIRFLIQQHLKQKRPVRPGLVTSPPARKDSVL